MTRAARDAREPTLRVRVRRLIDVGHGRHPRGVAHIAAASGLVRDDGRFWIVADDEHHLACVDHRSRTSPVALHRVFPGTLPDAKKARKRSKPDLECLLAICDAVGAPARALVALGSGSRPSRRRGAWLALAPGGRPDGAARRIDLADLYAPLARRFGEVNIEGAFRLGDRLCLLQRGDAADPRNAVVAYPWNEAVAWLEGLRRRPPRVAASAEFALGARDGVPYGFTDGAALDAETFVFSAAAEASDDAYDDGPTGGSMVGIADLDGRVRARARLAGRWKVEGIAPSAGIDALVLDLVTDADDPDRAAALLRVRWGRREIVTAAGAESSAPTDQEG